MPPPSTLPLRTISEPSSSHLNFVDFLHAIVHYRKSNPLKIYKNALLLAIFFPLMGHYINRSCIFVTCTTSSRTYCIQRKNIGREAALHRY